MTLDSTESVPTTDKPHKLARDYDFSTQSTALASYRTILQDHRIPLMPFYQRLDLIRHLWYLPCGLDTVRLSFDQMRYELLDYSRSEGYSASVQAIQKFLYTLNFAKCFSPDLGGSSGSVMNIPEEAHVPVGPVCNESEAQRAVHQSYMDILLRERAILSPPAVFELLYDSARLEESEMKKGKEEIEELCEQLQPPTAMAQALKSALQQQQGA